jgi:5-methyltetrahydrofolate corrinoid/iron sulfur protein methyltransferase
VYIIGEKINGMFKSVREAIRNRDAKVIRDLAISQLAAGCDALDVNTGPSSSKPVEDMVWLVKTIREATSATLAIDSARASVIEAGIALAGAGSIINSTSAIPEKFEPLSDLAAKAKCRLICLTINEAGVPHTTAERAELGLMMIARAAEKGLEPTDLFLDPIVLPVAVDQKSAFVVLETLKEFQLVSNPPPHTVIGLSNLSQGTKERSLIDRSFLAMAVAYGLDSAILNPLDEELMRVVASTQILAGKTLYCESFVKAYLDSKEKRGA